MSRSWCWWCGIWFLIKDGWGWSVRQGGSSVSHSSSCLSVCIHLFCFSALCAVWSCLHRQTKSLFSLSWRCRCYIGLGHGWDVCQLCFLNTLNIPSACIPQITRLCSSADLVDRDYQITSLHLIHGLFIHTVTLTKNGLKVDLFGKQC